MESTGTAHVKSTRHAVLALVSILLAPVCVLACNCVPHDSIVDVAGVGDVVALIRLETVSVGQSCTAPDSCRPQQRARYTAQASIRGNPDSLAGLTSGYGGGDCGIPLIAGAEYLVVLSPGSTHIGICNSEGPYPPAQHRSSRDDQRMRDYVDALAQRLAGVTDSVPDKPRTIRFDERPPPPPPPSN